MIKAGGSFTRLDYPFKEIEICLTEVFINITI